MFSHAHLETFLSQLSHQCLSFGDVSKPTILTKADASPLTEIDRGLSDFFKSHALARGFTFYSEEEHQELTFPALILDPLDGTRDFIEGRPECAVSAAWMQGPKLTDPHRALIYNPFTGFSLHSGSVAPWTPRAQVGPWLGMVSRSEWKAGLYESHQSSQFTLEPKGSIAFKLALLASGGCDFVVSLKPKNVWDIAAGTLLAHQRGFELWSNGQRLESLSGPSYPAPLLWARPHAAPSLWRQFSL